MKALVLAAGEGTRLRPLTTNTPKPLLLVAGRPFMSHVLEALSALDVKDIYILVGWKANKIKEYYGDGSRLGLRIKYLEQRERMGTAHAIGCADGSIDEPFVCINGDVIVFQDEHECRQALQDITSRLEEFGLTVNRSKTRITDMRPLAVREAPKGIPPEITFLGFTLYWKPCPDTGWELAVRTSDKSIKRFTDRLQAWLGEYGAQGCEVPTALLTAKLRGHRDYFDVAGDDAPTTPGGARGDVPPPVARDLSR